MDFTRLTTEQRQQFHDQGYLVVRNALDRASVDRLIEAGDRLVASRSTLSRDFSGNARFDGFRNVVALDDAFIPLLTCERTVPLIVQLFGSNIQLQTSHLIHTRPDPPDTPRNLRLPVWHRDIYGSIEDVGHARMPRISMKCAYYLTDVSERFSGVTLFAPGSNHLKTELEIDPETGDPAKVVEPQLKPGDAVFFENRTWHAAGPNLTGRTRKSGVLRLLLPLDQADGLPQAAARPAREGEPHRQTAALAAHLGARGPLRQWARNGTIAGMVREARREIPGCGMNAASSKGAQMDDRKVKIALIGTGNWGNQHARVLKKRTRQWISAESWDATRRNSRSAPASLAPEATRSFRACLSASARTW